MNIKKAGEVFPGMLLHRFPSLGSESISLEFSIQWMMNDEDVECLT